MYFKLLVVACLAGIAGIVIIHLKLTELSDKHRLLEDTYEPKIMALKEGSHDSPSLLRFPTGVTNVILNIGANVDPILPRKQDGPCTMAVVFEPIVPDKIKAHPRLQVISAAVSASPGLGTMTLMNHNAVSSSLSLPGASSTWNNNSNRDGTLKFVPVLSLRNVLDSIPTDINIDFLKTDMQGHDFAAILPSGDAMAQRKIPRLMTEVYVDDVSTYQGVTNDLCRDWIPFMESIGYELVEFAGNVVTANEKFKKQCANQLMKFPERPPFKAGLNEINAYWRLPSIVSEADDSLSKYQYTYTNAFEFSSEEYASCAGETGSS